MKWIGRRQSDNVEDRRGISSGGKTIVGGGLIGIIILLVNIFGGENTQMLTPILKQIQDSQSSQTQISAPLSKEDEEMGNFVRVVLADSEDIWSKLFAENGMTYKKPTLVLFRGEVQTACGGASSASGPFYCPSDQKVYMDLGFFEELKTKFGARGGDFAIAYVIAHEIGHHIQTLLGTSKKAREAQEGMKEAQVNKISVALELQADFYAGIFANYNKGNLDVGDIEEALSAAHAVGDDAIQSKMQGHIVPDSFTHGTSEERMYWFKKGFNSGDIRQGRTFEEIR